MNKQDVIKHSATIQISNKISLLQRKAWNILLANAYDDLPNKDEYQIKISELINVLNLKTKNDRYLKKIILDLMTIVVEFNLLCKDGKNKWMAVQLLGECSVENGIFTYSYGKMLRQRLYNPAIYARIKLSMQNKFSSKHTLALYELCIDYFIEKRGYGTTPLIEIEKFRELMGIEKSQYETFKELNKKIIKAPITEINVKTEIFVKQEYKKEGRKVVAVKFSIYPNSKNKNNEMPLFLQEIDKQESNSISPINSKSELLERLQKYFCLSSSQAKEVLNTYDENYILENLTYIENKIQEGQIKNIGAYTLKALKEDYRNKKSQFEIDKEEAKKQKEKEERRKEVEERQKLEYYQYQRQEAEKYKKTLSPEEIQHIKEKAEKEVDKTVKDGKNPDFTIPLLINIEMEKYLIEKSRALSLEEWQQKVNNNTT